MIILLDENFPLRFYTRLQKEGLAAQHILLTDRGIHDKQIIARLKQEELLFLTQDRDFVERVEIWLSAVRQFFAKAWSEKFFELYDDGRLHPVRVGKR
jgi:predicted nuclease of predicted toxin-antitoxin system